MRARPMVRLAPEPDGYGFVYGKVWDEQGAIHDVNVLPPESEWRGYTRLAGFEPHALEWIVYLDGEEVARLGNGTQLERDVLAFLVRPEHER